MSVVLEEIRESGGRVKGNGTLGNVQGNNLRGFREEGLGGSRREGIRGKILIPQPFSLSTLSPYQQKSPAWIRATPCHARLLGHFLFSLDSFYFPRTGFISCQQQMSRENNSCPSHFSPTKASNPLPHKGFRDLRNQLVQNTRKIKSVHHFGRN